MWHAQLMLHISLHWYSLSLFFMCYHLQAEGQGTVLDQFGNLANPLAHYNGTGPEIWEQTSGRVTHFVSSMGTTGTIMGTSRYLKEQNPEVRIIGLQPQEGSAIAGIRRWPKEYLPTIFQVCAWPSQSTVGNLSCWMVSEQCLATHSELMCAW